MSLDLETTARARGRGHRRETSSASCKEPVATPGFRSPTGSGCGSGSATRWSRPSRNWQGHIATPGAGDRDGASRPPVRRREPGSTRSWFTAVGELADEARRDPPATRRLSRRARGRMGSGDPVRARLAVVAWVAGRSGAPLACPSLAEDAHRLGLPGLRRADRRPRAAGRRRGWPSSPRPSHRLAVTRSPSEPASAGGPTARRPRRPLLSEPRSRRRPVPCTTRPAVPGAARRSRPEAGRLRSTITKGGAKRVGETLALGVEQLGELLQLLLTLSRWRSRRAMSSAWRRSASVVEPPRVLLRLGQELLGLAAWAPFGLAACAVHEHGGLLLRLAHGHVGGSLGEHKGAADRVVVLVSWPFGVTDRSARSAR